MARQTFKQRTKHVRTRPEPDTTTDEVIAKAHESAARARRLKAQAETFLQATA